MNFNIRKILTVLLLLILPSLMMAESWVKVAKNPEEGWKLLVDGEQISIHGVVWSFTPIGENYSYDLWTQNEDYIQRMIDTDAELLMDMGVNVIRSFSDIPPKWVTYLFQRYGIYTVINDLFGRYGMEVDGRWMAGTDYSDIRTRELILDELRETVEIYKGVPGVLFYMLGNENNYGLEWDSDAIEDLPVGQRLEIRAGYLYSLFEEGIQIVKEMDPTKPVGIVNGDIQYLNIINELVPSLDILGVNTYRGDAAYDLFYESIDELLNVPVVFTELGADAYNIITGKEDQYSQAEILKNQWEEIYLQSYNKGGFQNCLGAFVFEWMDEWWKHGMTEDLDIHDESGTWVNGAYSFDNMPGENNMNEEWFGIAAQSLVKQDGINIRVPRASYYLLQDLWKLDQISSTKEDVTEFFSNIQTEDYVPAGELAFISNKEDEDPIVSLYGEMTFLGKGQITDADFTNLGKEGLDTSRGEWLYLGMELNPVEDLQASVTLRVQGDIPDTVFIQDEYSRFGPVNIDSTVVTDEDGNPVDLTALTSPYLEIYDASLHYKTDFFDIDGYFHNGHSDWVAEGDFFNILPESFDFIGMDLEGSKAPIGVELTGKEHLDGWKLYAGPEIYWGADPQAILKYLYEGDTFSYGLVWNETFEMENPGVKEGGYSRRASAWLGVDTLPWVLADVGVLFANTEKIGELYDDVKEDGSGGFTVTPNQTVELKDTFAFKVELESSIFMYTQMFAKYVYAGLVAETNPFVSRNGSQFLESGSGNRNEAEAGFQFTYGFLSARPAFRARKPLSLPLSIADGGPRKSLFDPFVVFDNREAYEAELMLTWDPKGDTYFFDWNNDEREQAVFAAYLSFLYSIYQGPTDAISYINEFGDTASFGLGLPAVNGLWSLEGRAVLNPMPDLRFIGTFKTGYAQSRGEDSRIVNYYGASLATRYKHWFLDLEASVNDWGPENWYRTLNITYPLQFAVVVSRGFEVPSFMLKDNRIGLRLQGRTYDQYSPDDETNTGMYKWRAELTAYLNIKW